MRKSVTTDPEAIKDVLNRATVLWLALHDSQGPYCVPVNFAVDQDTIYIHSGRKGRKFEALCSGAPLSFSCAVDLDPKTGDGACEFSYRFKSVIGQGKPELLPETETERGLDAITMKHAGELLPYKEKVVQKTAVFAISINSATARIKA